MSSPKSRLVTRLAKAILKFSSPSAYAESVGSPLEVMELSTVLKLTARDYDRLWNARRTCNKLTDLEIVVNRYLQTEMKTAAPTAVTASDEKPDESDESEDRSEDRSDEPLVLTPAEQEEGLDLDCDSERSAGDKLAELVMMFPTLEAMEDRLKDNALNARPVEILKMTRSDLLDIWRAKEGGREDQQTPEKHRVRREIQKKIMDKRYHYTPPEEPQRSPLIFARAADDEEIRRMAKEKDEPKNEPKKEPEMKPEMKPEDPFILMNRLMTLKEELKSELAALTAWTETMSGEPPCLDRTVDLMDRIKSTKAALRSQL